MIRLYYVLLRKRKREERENCLLEFEYKKLNYFIRDKYCLWDTWKSQWARMKQMCFSFWSLLLYAFYEMFTNVTSCKEGLN